MRILSILLLTAALATPAFAASKPTPAPSLKSGNACGASPVSGGPFCTGRKWSPAPVASAMPFDLGYGPKGETALSNKVPPFELGYGNRPH